MSLDDYLWNPRKIPREEKTFYICDWIGDVLIPHGKRKKWITIFLGDDWKQEYRKLEIQYKRKDIYKRV